MRYDCTKNRTKIRSKIGDVVYNVLREKVYKMYIVRTNIA